MKLTIFPKLKWHEVRPGVRKLEIWFFGLLAVLCLGLWVAKDWHRQRYKVIERVNSDASLVVEVPVTLEHDGHKYHAQCNNIKGVAGSQTRGCELHVGMVVECQFFSHRESGYDLICGDKRNEKGDLDTYGENELLRIDKEEN